MYGWSQTWRSFLLVACSSSVILALLHLVRTMADTSSVAQQRTRRRPNRAKNKAPSRVELKLCTAYLYRKDGCTRGEDCNSLHICRYYMLQNCRARNNCKFSHDLSGSQPQSLLNRRFGIEYLAGQSLQTFKELFAATLKKPAQGTSDCEEQQDSGIQPQEQLIKFLQRFDHFDVTLTRGDSRYEDRSNEIPTHQAQPSLDRQLKICSFFVVGACKFTSHAGFRHCPTPYQWQIRDGKRSDWLEFTRQANASIEEQFCNVKNEKFSGAILACSERNLDSVFYKVTITFGVESFSVIDDSKKNQEMEVRRLSTVSEAQPRCPKRGHCTQWTWYWQENQNWIKFPKLGGSSELSKSQEIERNYLSFKVQKGPPQLDVITKLGDCWIDFTQMELTSLTLNSTHPLARRPKWTSPGALVSNDDGPSDHVGSVDNMSSAPKKPSVPTNTCTQKALQGRLQDTQGSTVSEAKDSSLSKPRETNRPPTPSKKVSSVQKKTKAEPVRHPSSSSDNEVPLKTGEQLASFLKAKASNLVDAEPELPGISSKPERSAEVVRPKTRNPLGPSKTLPLSLSSSDIPTAKDIQANRLPNQKEFTQICPHFLRGTCKYPDDKYTHKRHFPTPYQWQFLDRRVQGAEWQNFPSDENDFVEKAFCDVECKYHLSLSAPPAVLYVFFKESVGPMHGSTINVHVRRLSASASVLKSNWETAFCTEWIWYWLDETGKWIRYSEQNSKGIQAGIDSAAIEEKFIEYESNHGEIIMEFKAGTQRYMLDFAAMTQTNVRYGTCRKVRRRPKFFAMEERKKLARELSKAQKASVAVPTTWDNRGTQTAMRLVTLTESNREYTVIANLFWDTMDNNGTIVSIQRVQNLELWEDFCKMSDRMKKKNGAKTVLTKQLFHGTVSEDYATAICGQNFDWRLSGSNVGTLYGKGSYFARDACFSHSYTKSDGLNHRYVFVAKVLVGSYTTGKSEYVRPPPKDPQKPLEDLHDSCVNDMTNPTIYVVFEKRQVYPEYLIKYKEKSWTLPNPYGSGTRSSYTSSSSGNQRPPSAQASGNLQSSSSGSSNQSPKKQPSGCVIQ